jgi:hypothetical protein
MITDDSLPKTYVPFARVTLCSKYLTEATFFLGTELSRYLLERGMRR